MKTSKTVLIVITALTLGACSAKVESPAGEPAAPIVTRKTSPEVQELKVDTGIGTIQQNYITFYGPATEKDFYFTYTATADAILTLSSAYKSGYSCTTAQVVDAIQVQTLSADGSVSYSTNFTSVNSNIYVSKNTSYKLKVSLKGLQNCDTLYYDFMISYRPY